MTKIVSILDIRKALWHLRHGGIAGLKKQKRRQAAEKGLYKGSADAALAFQVGRGPNRRLSFNDYEFKNETPRFPQLTAAVVLDDFSLLAFSHEWHQIVLEPITWRNQVEAMTPDLLFVESAWAGNNGKWKYQLTGSQAPSEELRDLVDYFRGKGIPTVFWNKEDPPHYADFLETARLFDYVFTSDINRVPSYKIDLEHDRIGVLQFAAQPELHNPVRPRAGWHDRDIAFAGMYFAHKYPERRAQMDLLLDAAREAGDHMRLGLEIFSRHASADPNYRFPEPFSQHVVGSLSYSRMLTAYKAYKIFLNVNSVVDSPSMCARRIFEITASGTSVLSTPSLAITQMWENDEQFVAADKQHAAALINALDRNPELSARQLHRAQRKIWREHTYGHRVATVASAVLPGRLEEIDFILATPPVSLLVSSIRPHQVEHVFRTAGGFRGVDVELVLSTHGFSPNRSAIKRLQEEYGISNLVLIEQPASRSLGECLNECVVASSGKVLSKMDDDDMYGPDYLFDLANALAFSGADVVGKQAHYMYISDSNATLLRFPEREHRFTDLVMGPTITGTRDLFLDNRFAPISRGEDTAFLRGVSEGGGSIYSADKYNYAQFRGSLDHAWTVSDTELLSSGDVVFFGRPEEHITI